MNLDVIQRKGHVGERWSSFHRIPKAIHGAPPHAHPAVRNRLTSVIQKSMRLTPSPPRYSCNRKSPTIVPAKSPDRFGMQGT